MQCKLCQKEATLRNSHIIPEFVYGALYDEKHRFHVLSTAKETKNTFKQKGICEKLLCSGCESQLSEHERYVSLVFRGEVPLSIKKDQRIIHVEGLNYSSFKLFALSVLWRAGVSSLPVFKEVQLGPHEEVLRKMVRSSDPGAPEEYPFTLAPVLHKGRAQFDVILKPTKVRLESHQTYRFLFGGLAWVFVVSKHKLPATIVPAILSREGHLIMLEMEVGNMPFIVNMVQELAKNGKLIT